LSSGLPGTALAQLTPQLTTIINPANKSTKMKWNLSWSRALGNCGKIVFIIRVKKELIPLGKAWNLNLAILEKACFSSRLPGAALAQLTAIVSPINKFNQIKIHLQIQMER